MIPESAIGTTARFAKTVSEADVYAFAGVTGDFSVNHVNEQFMATTRYGQRIAHGALLIGFMSTASVRMIDELGIAAVSLGYDGIRFLAPVFFGDTVTVEFVLTAVERDGQRGTSAITVVNQSGDLVAVGRHLLHCLDETEGIRS